jgi:hypothetical protein
VAPYRDFVEIRQPDQMLDPLPRVNIIEPLPVLNIAAQYETTGPQLRSTLLFGRTGILLVVACTVGSEPKFTKANEDVGLVTNSVSPEPAS